MGKRVVRLIALCLTFVMLFSGCAFGSLIEQALNMVGNYNTVHYKDMEYTRPSLVQIQDSLEECYQLLEQGDVEAVMDGIYRFYNVYDQFSTAYYLANIRYSHDLTDIYWEEEYNFCTESAPTVDAALDSLYTAIAESSLREQLEADAYFGADFFAPYTTPSVWDETFLKLMEQEAQLENQYYLLSGQAQNVDYYSEEYFAQNFQQMAELFVELVQLRQQIAEYAGYEDYPSFAYDFSFYRDYSPEEAADYLRRIGDALYAPYVALNADASVWESVYAYCGETETFQYVRDAAMAMGGTAAAAFSLLQYAGLYDIVYGENKYDSSFECYLWSYYAPFIFMCPHLDQTDKLTFAHEFGHFANDYVCHGSYVGIDVAEVQSQAFAYLSLCYGEESQNLTRYAMADSLLTYVEQAAYALFEHQVYLLPEEEVSVETVSNLYAEICGSFGFDSWSWDSRDFITIPHFYTDPMYIISYVVSNDLAMQIYSMELEKAGEGLALYEQCLTSQDSYLLWFAENYGLESPFAEERLESVAAEFNAMFG